jgi:hypothetical protein
VGPSSLDGLRGRLREDCFPHPHLIYYSKFPKDWSITQIEMSSNAPAEKIVSSEIGQVPSPLVEKNSDEEQHLEHVKTSSLNLEYNDDEEEPEIHARTYVALAAMLLLNLVQVFALQGPPAVVRLHLSTNQALK